MRAGVVVIVEKILQQSGSLQDVRLRAVSSLHWFIDWYNAYPPTSTYAPQELVNFYKGKFAEIQQEWLYQDKRVIHSNKWNYDVH